MFLEGSCPGWEVHDCGLDLVSVLLGLREWGASLDDMGLQGGAVSPDLGSGVLGSSCRTAVGRNQECCGDQPADPDPRVLFSSRGLQGPLSLRGRRGLR